MAFQGEVAIVTGGSGGLGRGVCSVLAEAGLKVVVAARTALEDPPEGVVFRKTDFADEWSVKGLASEVASREGRIDMLVNLIGGFTMGPFLETSEADLDKMYQLNLRSVFSSCRQVLPVMTAQGHGKVVNVGAKPALRPAKGLSAYAATKSALLHLTETLAIEMKAHGIQVNAVLPGTIDTPANRSAMPNADRTTWVSPESIGQVVRFLCSSEADDVTGALIPVYGRG